MKAPVAIGLAVAFFVVFPLLGVAWFFLDGMGKMRESASQFVTETLPQALTQDSELLREVPEAQSAVDEMLREHGEGWSVVEVRPRHAKSSLEGDITYHTVRIEATVSRSDRERLVEVTVRRPATAAVEDVEKLAKREPVQRAWVYRELQVR